MKVCLVGSSGGHLTHLYMLKPFWKDKEHFWVTFDKEDAKSMLKGEKVYDFIEAESGAEEKTEIPIIIKWTNKSNQLIESKATIKYDKWNAYGWFTTLKVKLGLDVF